MSITLAICTDALAFSQNQILNRMVAVRYPGALWLPELAERLVTVNIETITGDVALARIASGTLKAKDVWIIQEDVSVIGSSLMQLGAVPKVLLCGESPLFAADFYHALPKLSRSFEHCVLFRGALQNANPQLGKHPLWFPSFDVKRLTEPKPWSGRKHLVMVAGNKYWKIRRNFLRAIAAKFRDFIYRKPQRFSITYASSQLHDKRLALLSHFGGRQKLDLFGAQWDELRNLPQYWQNKLEPIIKTLAPKICGNKQEIISNYKFSFCIENIEFPGYVTEKIIDCLVAGVVPVYCGAPDIADFVPEDCFINVNQFSSLEELSHYLEGFTEKQGREMIARGQLFLREKGACMFSYGTFAERIVTLLEETN